MGQVPRSAVRIDIGVGNRSQRSVHLASLGRRSRLVDRRTDERMAEYDTWRHFQQAVSFDIVSCGLVDAELLCCSPQKTGIARWLGSCQ
jgi:hypothetical protein